MSTKSSIKSLNPSVDHPGFHLYEDLLDDDTTEGETPVYLRLEGVAVELCTLGGGAGAALTITLPRELARGLGLLPDVLPSEAVTR